MHGPRQSGNKVERRGKKSPSFSLPYNTYDTRITPRRGIRIVPFTPPTPDLRSRSRGFLESVEGRRWEGGRGGGGEHRVPVERLLSRGFDLSGNIHPFSRHTIHALGRFAPVYLAIKISLVFDRPRPDVCIYFSMYDLAALKSAATNGNVSFSTDARNVERQFPYS